MSFVPAPGPYLIVEAPGGTQPNGINLYITDTNGRKIAAVWGKANGEKYDTAMVLANAWAMFEILKEWASSKVELTPDDVEVLKRRWDDSFTGRHRLTPPILTGNEGPLRQTRELVARIEGEQ